MPLQKLYTLPLGQWANVREVETDSPLYDRLRRLGFQENVRVCRMYTDSADFLSAYRIDNTMIALRRCDAAAVLVEA